MYEDLIDTYARRGSRTGPSASNLWFWREVIVACGYGVRDAWADGSSGRRVLVSAGPYVQAMRALRRRPGYALTIIALMSVAAGSISGLSGIARVIQGPRDPELADVRVIVGTDSERGWRIAYLSVPEISDLDRSARTIEGVGVFLTGRTAALGGGDAARPITLVLADAPYFRIMGARAEIGRRFTDAEGMSREGPFVLLSHSLWRGEYDADPNVIGRSIEIAGRNYPVLGVIEKGFRDAGAAERTDLWLPLGEAPAFLGTGVLTGRSSRWMMAVTRVHDGQDRAVAEEADRVAAALMREYPRAHRGRGFAFRDLESWWFGPVKRPIRIMLVCGIGLLVLVVCNLAALFRVRREERETEMAIRAALGAGRGVLLGVLLAEAVILAVVSASVGSLIAIAVVKWAGTGAFFGLPHFAVPRVHIMVVLACAALVIPLSLLAGASGEDRVRSAGGSGRWFLAAEAALAAVLLTGGGALVRDALEVARLPTGFDAPGLLTARIDLTSAITDPSDVARAAGQRVAFGRELVATAPSIPGVKSAALVGPSVLGNAEWHLGFVPEGLDPREHAGRWFAQQIVVTPGALETLGVTVLEGRDLSWSDQYADSPVAIVDQRIARAFWPDGGAVGRRFCASASCRVPFTIVGVAEVAKHRGRTAPDAGVVGDVYVPYPRSPSTASTLAIRTDGTGRDVVAQARAVVAELAPWAVISDVRWMDDRLSAGEFVQRATASLVAGYAVVAAILSLVGTYGLVAMHLGRRRRDIALRMALGAGSTLLARTLLIATVLPVTAGAVAGAIAGLLLVPNVTTAVSRVGGIGGWGLLESTVVAGLLVAAGLGAAGLPLMRLTSLRPMEILRSD